MDNFLILRFYLFIKKSSTNNLSIIAYYETKAQKKNHGHISKSNGPFIRLNIFDDNIKLLQRSLTTCEFG